LIGCAPGINWILWSNGLDGGRDVGV